MAVVPGPPQGQQPTRIATSLELDLTMPATATIWAPFEPSCPSEGLQWLLSGQWGQQFHGPLEPSIVARQPTCTTPPCVHVGNSREICTL
jgi:hypothetical protein